MARLTEEALAATRGLARSLLAEALGAHPTTRMPEPVLGRDRRRRWTPHLIIQAVDAFVQREGHFPVYEEWKHAQRWGLPAFDTIRRYWGSCTELVYAVRLRQTLRRALLSTEEESTWRRT